MGNTHKRYALEYRQRMVELVRAGRNAEELGSAGTVLVREWRGVRHRVTVLDDAVVYRSQRYKSLSEVARIITGTRWSGPRFFGLRRPTKESANG